MPIDFPMLNFVFLVRPCVFTYMTFFPNVLPTPDIASKGIVLVNNSDLLYPGAVPFYFSEQSVPIIDNYSATIFGKCGRICKRRRRGSNKLDNPNVFQSWEAEVFRMEDTWDMIVQRDYAAIARSKNSNLPGTGKNIRGLHVGEEGRNR